MRREACACGGTIAAPIDDWDSIAAAIYWHNMTDLHLAWRFGQ